MIETDISQLQQDVGEWAEEQFGAEQPPEFPVIGAGEELGELTCSVLKRAQGIDDSPKYRDRDTIGDEAEMDAVGDIVIYLCDAAYRIDPIDLGDGLDEAMRESYPSSADTAVGMIRFIYSDLGKVMHSRLEPMDEEHMIANAEKYEWAEGPTDDSDSHRDSETLLHDSVTRQQEMEMLELRMGKVVRDLVRFCEIRGFEFDECVQMAASEVLDREWDSTIEEAYVE